MTKDTGKKKTLLGACKFVYRCFTVFDGARQDAGGMFHKGFATTHQIVPAGSIDP
ncbi:hypothetical protein [Photorhabdus luminescens]|uniref:hypothetical protein n=1 Tax=Photorhabdus luminescens TaxID=29488 RepID=UPI0018646A82|nr:hypothetical protein [Photorhabdus luminescens]